MTEIATINFRDADTGDDACAIVRVLQGCVGITLSLKHDGDIEVFMGRTDVEGLIAALQKAIATT